VIGITGRERVDGVLVRGPDGTERTVAVESVVFTGDFIPDNELARLPHSRSIRAPRSGVRGRRRDDRAGVFATGNLVHPAETADVVALRARRVGHAAVSWLRRGGDRTSVRSTVRLRVADPLLWSSRTWSNRAGRDRIPSRQNEDVLGAPRLDVTQAGRLLGSYRSAA